MYFFCVTATTSSVGHSTTLVARYVKRFYFFFNRGVIFMTSHFLMTHPKKNSSSHPQLFTGSDIFRIIVEASRAWTVNSRSYFFPSSEIHCGFVNFILLIPLFTNSVRLFSTRIIKPMKK